MRLFDLLGEIQAANAGHPTKLENLVLYAWQEAVEEGKRLREVIDSGPPTRDELFSNG